MASGETLPLYKEALVQMTVGRSALRIWMFTVKIADDSILGLDVLRGYNAAVDLKHHVLGLDEEKVSWHPRTRPRLFSRVKP
jgi:hypothetical protein